jgi:hypothetical protein
LLGDPGAALTTASAIGQVGVGSGKLENKEFSDALKIGKEKMDGEVARLGLKVGEVKRFA